jgi:hypothetical protein
VKGKEEEHIHKKKIKGKRVSGCERQGMRRNRYTRQEKGKIAKKCERHGNRRNRSTRTRKKEKE